jgi:electron transfer flavoprotein beta subunit
MGADEGLLLDDDAFEGGDWNGTVNVLSAAIQKLGNVDAVFCGRQAADFDMGQTGIGIAETLGWSAAIIAKDVKVEGDKMVVQRVLPDGFQTLKLPMPSVVTVSNELGEPRYPKLAQIMQAAKKTVTKWSAADLGVDLGSVGAAGARLKLERLYIPQAGGNVILIEGETPQEMAQNLVKALQADKVL